MNVNDFVALIENLPDFEWVQRAACGGLDLTDLDRYFVEVGRSVSSETIAVCEGCPVRLDCLDHAYVNEITSGYFGGLSPSRRKALSHAEARALVIGRP